MPYDAENVSSMTRREFCKAAGAAAMAGTAAALFPMSSIEAIEKQKDTKKRPNVLLLFSDQHNARTLGCSGHPDIQTPHLDRLAGRGVRFESAWCHDGICMPSRANLFTGLYPRTTGVLHNPDSPAFPNEAVALQKHLRANGYRTGTFGKRHLPPAWDTDWDVSYTTLKQRWDRSDESYWEWIESEGKLDVFKRDWNAEFGKKGSSPMAARISELDADHTMEAYTARRTIDFIRAGARQDKPWFAWSSYYRPHQPYTPLREYFERYNMAKLTLPANINEPIKNFPPTLQHMLRRENNPWCFARAAREKDLYRFFLACYYACMTEIDHHIGQVLKALEETGQADNTLVIYTSDHGDFVGHHGLIAKVAFGHNVYSDTLRVPMIASLPKQAQPGRVSDDLVGLIDLYPTILEACGVENPQQQFAGESLLPVLRHGKAMERDMLVSENWLQVSAITKQHTLGKWVDVPQKIMKRYRFMESRKHGDMLFDRKADPLETRNLAGTAKVRDVESKLRTQLTAWEKAVSDRGKQANSK